METRRAPRLRELTIPFAISFVLFPIKRCNAPLFETLVYLVLLASAGALLNLYFRGRPAAVLEALLVGGAVAGDEPRVPLPMFAFGPMRMTVARYYSEIGLAHPAFPVLAFAAARLGRP